MKLVRYRTHAGEIAVGELRGSDVFPLARPSGDGTAELLAIAMERAAPSPLDAPHPLEDVQLLAPVEPPAIRDFITFEEHYRATLTGEGAAIPPEWYRTPVFYFTNVHRLLGPDDEVRMPDTAEADFELEVAVVVGRDGADLSPQEAVDVIAGYTIFNDFSARDIQRREMVLKLGPSKSKDFANALGPALVTPDELRGEPGRPAAQLRSRVNGRQYSADSLEHMHFSFAELISHASQHSLVRAGDVLGSGTCATGCIYELSQTHGSEQYPWLRSGDEVELEVEGIGVLRNVVA